MVLQYDYSKARKECADRGMAFDEQIIPQVDLKFTEAHLTQAQVDAVLHVHIFAVARLFTPRNYGYLGRIGIALFFLFSRKTL